jgi:hypothetical protein
MSLSVFKTLESVENLREHRVSIASKNQVAAHARLEAARLVLAQRDRQISDAEAAFDRLSTALSLGEVAPGFMDSALARLHGITQARNQAVGERTAEVAAVLAAEGDYEFALQALRRARARLEAVTRWKRSAEAARRLRVERRVELEAAVLSRRETDILDAAPWN